jgi:hypothetical protein
MNSSNKTELRVDWASHEAAKYACEHWHYSRCLPAGKSVKVGVWENNKFIGVILFSRGANPHIASPYQLTQCEVCELTRIALCAHNTPVSRVLSFAIKLLKRFSPGVRLVVSYADKDQNHHGGIYQATNWIYTGLQNPESRGAFIVKGKKVHPRSIGAKHGIQSLDWIRKNLDPNAKEYITQGKHKYLMPLDDKIRAKFHALAQPYPKRAKQATTGSTGEAAEHHRPARSKS